VNRAWLETLGYSEEEVSELSLFDIIHPDCMDYCMEMFGRLLAGETLDDVDAIFTAKDGRKVYVSGGANARFEGDRPVATRAIFRDVTTRKLAEAEIRKLNEELEERVEERTAQLEATVDELRESEEKVRESEERYALVVRGSNDGIWDWDVRTGELFWNDRFFEIIGLSPLELTPTLDLFLELLHPDDRQRISDALTEHLEHGTQYDVEYRLRHSSGEYRHCVARGEAQRDKDGVPCRMAGTISDITERRQAEEEIRRQKEFYETLLNVQSEVGEGFVIIEGQRLTYANEAFCELTGYSIEELRAMPSILDLYPPEYREGALERLRLRMSGQESQDYREVTIIHKGGRRVHLEVGVKNLQINGRTRFVAIARDITERKRNEEEIRRLNATLEKRVEERTAELREAEERFRSAFEHTPVGMAIVAFDGHYLGVNNAICEILGYSREELQSKT
jgi:PAS domain S-box-containing protein